jgi:hemerythrin-like metal-binding protein
LRSSIQVGVVAERSGGRPEEWRGPHGIFHEIKHHAEFHFACEERLMAEHDYTGSAQHREVHRRLLDDIRNLSLESDGPSVSPIPRYLQAWLLRHVHGADRDLASALLACGAD